MYQIDVIETSPTKATVIVESSTLKEQDLLRSGRVQDALDLMNELEYLFNSPSFSVLNQNWLERKIKNMKSYDPNNK